MVPAANAARQRKSSIYMHVAFFSARTKKTTVTANKKELARQRKRVCMHVLSSAVQYFRKITHSHGE